MAEITRFAPSPNGPLHLGHAYSAVVSHDLAAGGEFLLRIEDIDGARSRPEHARSFRADLAWLGLAARETPPQGARLANYEKAAAKLREQGLLYRCTCTRADITAAATRMGPDGPVYPGTCKHRSIADGVPAAWRLDVGKAQRVTGDLFWQDANAGLQQARPDLLGDVVLVRRDLPASYHLAATLDDAADGVTVVTRGADLFHSTHIHRLLQALLGLPVPRWHHHGLLVESDGKKLAKRRGSPALADRRLTGEDGAALADALRNGAFPAGISLSPPPSTAP